MIALLLLLHDNDSRSKHIAVHMDAIISATLRLCNIIDLKKNNVKNYKFYNSSSSVIYR